MGAAIYQVQSLLAPSPSLMKPPVMIRVLWSARKGPREVRRAPPPQRGWPNNPPANDGSATQGTARPSRGQRCGVAVVIEIGIVKTSAV